MSVTRLNPTRYGSGTGVVLLFFWNTEIILQIEALITFFILSISSLTNKYVICGKI